MQPKEAIARIQRQLGRQDMLIKDKGRLLASVDENAALIENDQAVMSILNELQGEYATSSVKLYSELLTSMVRSVMPDYSQDIQLKPGVYANKPALDIAATNADGEEELIDDQGGSISNLLASGLRFIGLALSSNRRIAILDESDCWLESALVPKFLTVIHEMCVKLGLQVIFVSHHHNALDDLGVAKVRLASINGVTRVVSHESATITTDTQPEEAVYAQAMNDSGIRFIRLRNYMSHADSMIHLQPGLTALVGENNIGKSVVTRAFSDLITNNRNAKRIRRNENESMIELGLESGYTLTWQLNAKSQGQPAGSYSLLDADGHVVHMDRHTNGVPEWLHTYLAMADVNGLNLHIGHQKDPLFVLNPAISRHKRAELIHLGNEYEQVNQMIKKHRQNVTEAKRSLKELRASIDNVSSSLSVLAPLEVLEAAAAPITYGSQSAFAALNEYMDVGIDNDSSAQAALLREASHVEIGDNKALQALHAYLSLASRDTGNVTLLARACKGQDAAYIASAEQTLRKLRDFATSKKMSDLYEQVVSVGSAMTGTQLERDNDLLRSVEVFIHEQEVTGKITRDIAISQQKLSQIEKELIASGNVCPTCKQFTANKGGQHAHSHH